MAISFQRGFEVGICLRQVFARDRHLLINQVLHMDTFDTPSWIMVSPQASHTFSSVIRGHHIYKETWSMTFSAFL